MTDVLPNVILITNSTGVAHLVTPHSTVCGRWNVEYEWLDYDHGFDGAYSTQRFTNDYSCRVRRACDGAIRGTPDKLCSECDAHVPDHRYPVLFDTHQFAYIDGMEIGEYDDRHMNREQWQANRV